MNHSMKKKIAFTFLVFGGILALSSCKNDDMEVFVGEDLRNKEIIEAIKAFPEPKTEVAEEDINENYKYLMPDGYSDYIKSNVGGRSGYYGYVDLGLSVKWATNNFNNPLNYNDGSISPNELYQKAQEDITPVEKPGVKEYNKQYPTTMSYDEYLDYMDMEKLVEEYDNYERYLTKMDNAYTKACNTYNRNAQNFTEHIYEFGNKYVWGALSDWTQHAQSDANSPQNIAGNPEYDATTKFIGEGWHTPTRAEWQELVDKCQWEDHDRYWLITGPSGKKIILPNWNFIYNTSERADNITKWDLYDVYEFHPNTKSIVQKAAAEHYASLIRPVYSK